MRSMNFPAKVFHRQTTALERLKTQKVAGKGSKLAKLLNLDADLMEIKILQQKERISEEIESLENSLKIAGSARNLRSKKNRTGKAKISYN